jgi:hypothetical protein
LRLGGSLALPCGGSLVHTGSSADEAEVGLVDEGGGLKRLTGLLLSEFGGGQFAELVIDEGQELLGSVRIARFDLGEDAGDVGHGEQDTRRRAGAASKCAINDDGRRLTLACASG